MKTRKAIEALIRHLDIQPRITAHNKTLADMVEAHNAHQSAAEHHDCQPIWRTLMENKTARFALAALIAIVLLVPLSYATSNFVKGLVAGSYAKDSIAEKFELDKDIWIKLEIGTKEQPQIITATNVRFFVEDGQLRGSLRCSVMAWPEHAWRTTIELLDAQGNRLHRAEYVRSSNNVPVSREKRDPHFPCAIRFSSGLAENTALISRFKIGFEAIPPDQPVTPDAWVTSNVLAVVHGRVTDANGEPIPGATVQIRERQPRPGHTGIAAPDVLTDQQGFYSYDEIDWPYTVGAIVYEPTPSGQGCRHQYQGWNKVLEGSQRVDFAFARFPEGTATLSGVVTDPNGAATKEFKIDARLRIGWDDESAEYRYSYGHREAFATPDGRFEIPGLAAGTYLVFVLPQDSLGKAMTAPPQTYTRQLQDGQETIIEPQDDTETWYGRVLFEDGSPASPEASDYVFQVVVWGQDPGPKTVATVSDDGYFAALLSEADMARLGSGQTRLKVALRGLSDTDHYEQGEVFPAEKLSPLAQDAGVIRMARPHFHFGRLLYENGEPAVLPAAPWSGAEVFITLRYTRPAATAASMVGRPPALDPQGYFSLYLTDEQRRLIQDGQASIEIMHPSYKWERESLTIAQFPGEMLSAKRNEAGSYVLPVSEAARSLSDLKHYLDSAFMMKSLGEALSQYAGEHGQTHPSELRYLLTSTSESEALIDQVEYFPVGTVAATAQPTETVLAYDRALLDATGNTHVLFADGHLEFCRPRRLEILGIHGPNAAVSQ